MIRNILMPLDGSPFAEHALPLALNIAQLAGATLRVALVHTPSVAVYGADVVVDVSYDAAVREHGAGYLKDVVGRLKETSPVNIVAALLDGSVADTLQEYASAVQTDLIVMATHGRGPLSRFWLGSVADRLVRRAAMPVLLVHPAEIQPDLTLRPTLRRILVPLDGSPLAEQILEPALELGALMRSEFTLMRVIEPIVLPEFTYRGAVTPAWDAVELGKVETEAHRYLDQAADQVRARNLLARTKVVSNQQAALAILESSQAEKVDLIALASHARGGLARMLMGSVADKVIRGGGAAVLIHHPASK